jgi:hypothetical protein
MLAAIDKTRRLVQIAMDKMKLTVFLYAALTFSMTAMAQQIPDVTVDGRTIQFHAFASQGFIYTNDNNYLTMKTSQGSFDMTDGGINVSSQLTDKFRVGAQVYDRLLGDLSHGRVLLDWAYGDYKLTDWLGIRAGKVKTALGLYNDTQDMDALHTFALLPQSIYPLDLRSSTISHIGVDAYGTIARKHLGSLDYTLYVGRRPSDPDDGVLYVTGRAIADYTGLEYGADLRWTTPIKGLLAGVSHLRQTPKGQKLDADGVLYTMSEPRDQVSQFYVQYTLRGLTLESEYNRHHGYLVRLGNRYDQEYKSWYAAASYQLTKRFSVGSYYSRFYPDVTVAPDTPDTHLWDKVITGRVDLTSHWYLKVEGHFIDGHGDSYSARGFYLADNPNGLAPTTNMLVIRTGFSI